MSACKPEMVGPLNDAAVRWSDVAEATYLIEQRFCYTYPGPIADLHHRLMVVPREHHGEQRRLATSIDVTPQAVAHDTSDAFGNPVATFFARRVDGAIAFTHRSTVTRTRAAHREHMRNIDDSRLLTPTALTAPSAALRDAAATLRVRYPHARDRAQAVNALVFETMRYVAGSTDGETSAAVAFERRAGVCQDYVHVALAIARHAGLPARYVSGHLLGEGGTHAWIELLIADDDGVNVVAYDPTHGRLADMRYISIAVGCDYDDVAPTSGVFTAPYNGELTATKRVTVTSVRYLA